MARADLYGARFLLAVATVQVFLLQLGAANPTLTHEFIGTHLFIDVLLLAYAVPAIFAFVLSGLFEQYTEALPAKFAAGAGFVLLFAYVTLEVRHAFRGAILAAHTLNDTESYAYSITWLILAVSLLALGIALKHVILRYAALAILVVVVLKVFLIDMSDLSGLYRVGSFLGLRLSLVGIGLVYQYLVFPHPTRPPKET